MLQSSDTTQHTAAPQPMIAVRGLSKQYGLIRAIDRLDFTVNKGDVVGFLGPNGAGKTTTMRILCGSLGATAGHATVRLPAINLSSLKICARPIAPKRPTTMVGM